MKMRSGGAFADVGGQSNACGLEHGADHAGCRRTDSNGLAILFDGPLLQAIQIVQKRLPFGLDALFLAQPRQFLGEGQRKE